MSVMRNQPKGGVEAIHPKLIEKIKQEKCGSKSLQSSHSPGCDGSIKGTNVADGKGG